MKLGNRLVLDLKNKASRFVSSKEVKKGKKNIEKILKARYKEFEPRLLNFYTGVRRNAVKYGLPVDRIENRVQHSFQATKDNLEKVSQFIPFFVAPGEKKAKKRAQKKQTKKKQVRKKTGKVPSRKVTKKKV